MLFNKRKILSAISVLLIHALILSNIAFAIPKTHTLAPPTRFNPIIRKVNGIRTNIKFTMDEIHADSFEDNGRKLSFKLKFENDLIFRRVGGDPQKFRSNINHSNPVVFMLWELIKNSYDSFIDRFEELGIKPEDFTGEITIETFYEDNNVVINVIDNGKTINLRKNLKPIHRTRTLKHFGGDHKAINTIIRRLSKLGGSIKWHQLEDGKKTQIRIPG